MINNKWARAGRALPRARNCWNLCESSLDRAKTPSQARLGDVTFDMEREELRRGPEHIPLTSTEARLLKLLAERPGAVFQRDDLMRILAPGGGERTVDVQVNRLRQKIEPDPKAPRYLQTVRGQGYILRPD